MKKFLAVLFALIFALSATTVAFAGVETLTCDTCFEVLPSLAEYNKHVSGGCLVDFEPCKYCGGNIANENLEAHQLMCPKGAGKCEFCGKDYATQADYAAHKEADCKVTTSIGDKIPVATVKIVVEGDINGDGVINVLDASIAELASNSHAELEGCFFLAANLDTEEGINAKDYSAVLNKALAA